MIDTTTYKIELDLDRERIKTVLYETYNICKDTLEVEFEISNDDFFNKMKRYLESNRVTTPVLLELPSKEYPELKIEVDPRKKSVIARMRNRKKRILLNRVLTKL